MLKQIYQKLLLLFVTVCIYVPMQSQGTWVWVSGSSTINTSGNFGTQGVPSTANHPGGLYECANWRDAAGNMWIYGGRAAAGPVFSDMWKFNPYTLEWTWIKGPGTSGLSPSYGTINVSNINNTPGARLVPLTWVDNFGTFWMYGGSNQNGQRHADLWKYDVTTNMWTWVDGSQLTNAIEINGTKGVPANINTPGSRGETTVAWVDASNNLWFYGGQINTSSNYFNDVWKYNITTGQWAWMDGNNFFQPNANPVYGTKGVPNNTNDPGARNAYSHWKDINGNLWLCGGTNGSTGPVYNDIWKYDMVTLQWTWMYGSNLDNDTGNYAVSCYFDAANLPRARTENKATYKDERGNIWMFGGANENATGDYNDMWIFRMDSMQWKWLGGSNQINLNNNYGSLGIADPSNLIPARDGAIMFGDTLCNTYIFGGTTWGIFGSCYGDVWKFVPDSQCVPCTPLALSVAAFTASDSLICQNNSVLFTDASTGNVSSWQWTFAGGIPATSNVQNPGSVIYNTPGQYSATLTVNNGININTTSYTITVNAPPSIWLGNDTLICDTASYTITVNNTFNTYLWQNGSTLSTFTTNASGQFWVVVNDGVCNATDTINITYSPCALPLASFSATDTLLCEKGSIDFTDASTGNPTNWLWYFSGASPATSTLQNPAGIYYANYGVYNVSLVVTNAAGSDSVFFANYVSVVPNPPQPVVNYNNTFLCSTTAVGYQWYLNNVPIANATAQCLVPQTPGNYFVIITDSNGCNSASNSFVVTGFASNGESNGVTIFPNPTTNQCSIIFDNNILGKLTISIYDCKASLIKTIETFKEKKVFTLPVNTENLNKGIYYIYIKSMDENIVLKFSKM